MKSLARQSLLLVALSCASVAVSRHALAQEAFTNRVTELKASPSVDAPTVAPLNAETPLQVIGRQNGWTEVKYNAQSGWVRAFHVRFVSTVSTSGEGSPLGALGGLLGGNKRVAAKGTSNIGVRGLSTEEIQSATPNLEAFAALQGFRTDPPNAQRFAADGKLSPVKVDYVEAEASSPTPLRKGARR